jgi:hypothetical protein
MTDKDIIRRWLTQAELDAMLMAARQEGVEQLTALKAEYEEACRELRMHKEDRLWMRSELVRMAKALEKCKCRTEDKPKGKKR